MLVRRVDLVVLLPPQHPAVLVRDVGGQLVHVDLQLAAGGLRGLHMRGQAPGLSARAVLAKAPLLALAEAKDAFALACRWGGRGGGSIFEDVEMIFIEENPKVNSFHNF